MTFCKSFFPAIFLVAFHVHLSGAEAGKNAADGIELIVNQLTSLSEIQSKQDSLFLIGSETGQLEPGFGDDDIPEITGTFKLFYKKNRLLYDVEIVTPKGVSCSQVEANDGEKFQFLNRNGGLLMISGKPFVNDVVMREGHFFFMPFLFLQPGFKTNAFAQLSYVQLTDPDNWRNAATYVRLPSAVQESTVDGRPCLKVTRIGSALDSISGQPCSFDVYFDKQANGYPIKWDLKLASGAVAMSYKVEKIDYIKLKTGENVPYPKLSVLRHYKDAKLRDTARLEIKEIRFGTVTDEDTSIDPASAIRIRDIDNGVTIAVPK